MSFLNDNNRLLNRDTLDALFSFLVIIILGYWFDWQARDLIWGLWLSSLCLGMFVFVAQFIVWPVSKAETALARVAALFGGMFMLAFFTIHYGGFHLGHSVFLALFFPVQGLPGLEGIPGDEFETTLKEMYKIILLTYWPIALVTLWSQRDLILTPAGKQEEGKNQSFNPMSVYKYIVKTHILIFVLAAFKAFKIESFWVYVVICVFYFFPFQIIFKNKWFNN